MRCERREELARLAEAMRAASAYRPDPDRAPVVLALPFRGRWLARNTPARRVPSHGTHFLGQSFAIDFAAVDRRRRTAAVLDWRTLVATEPVERFFAFGAPILAPAPGEVVAVHDDEVDHPARRSPLTLTPHLLTQGSRLRRGLDAVVGNHLILALDQSGPYVVLACAPAPCGCDPVSQSAWVRPLPSAATRETPPSRTCTCRSWTRPNC